MNPVAQPPLSQPPLSQPPLSSRPHCAVIGGGFAGSSAAIALAEAGWRVTLIEAKSSVGGRVYSLHDRTTGEVIDNGQHLLMGCYTSTLHVLNVLGTASMLRPQAAMCVDFVDVNMNPDSSGTTTSGLTTVHRLDAGLLPGKAGMAVGLMRLGGLSWGERFQAVKFMAALRLGWIKHDAQTRRQTTLELLRTWGQSDRVVARLWEPIILATLNAQSAEAAATLLIEVLNQAFFTSRAASRLLLPRMGLEELLAPLPAWLDARGSTVQTGLVQALVLNESAPEPSGSSEGQRVCGVRLADGTELAADAVIAAVPPFALKKIIQNTVHNHNLDANLDTSLDALFGALPATLESFTFSPIVSVYLWFDRDFVPFDFAAMLGTTTQWIFNRRRMCDAPTSEIAQAFGGHLSLTVSASDGIINASNDVIVEQCMNELRQAFAADFDGASGVRLLHSRVVKEKLATPRITPDLEAIRPSAETVVRGLFLAGDWTATGLPATIESAARSGLHAASTLIRSK